MRTDEKESQPWVVKRTLKDFHELRIQIARKFPDIPECLPLIKIFGGLNQQEKEQNIAQVMNFVQDILKRTDVMTSSEAVAFFELPQESIGNKPKNEELMIPTDYSMKWPISHLHYNPKDKIFIVAASDINQATQLAKDANNYN